jgi:hypothetical protein
MNKNIAGFVVAFVLSLFSSLALAAVPAPFGLALGVATLEEVETVLKPRTTLTSLGVNQYSGGEMRGSNGVGLGIDGLRDVLFIFDKSGVLVGVVMTLDKFGNEAVRNTLKTLSAKYRLVKSNVPPVGNAYAQLKQGDVVIEVDSPHLSFQFDITYLTQGFRNTYLAQSRAAAEAAEQARNGKF